MYRSTKDNCFELDSFFEDLTNKENNSRKLSSGIERELYSILFSHFLDKPINNSRKALCELFFNYYVDNQDDSEQFIHEFLKSFLIFNDGDFYLWEKKWNKITNLKQNIKEYFYITDESNIFFIDMLEYIFTFDLKIIVDNPISLDLKPSQIHR